MKMPATAGMKRMTMGVSIIFVPSHQYNEPIHQYNE